jgi:hypothetical protein
MTATGILVAPAVAQAARLRTEEPGELIARHSQPVIPDMSETARLANNGQDPGTVDLFSRTVQLHDLNAERGTD